MKSEHGRRLLRLCGVQSLTGWPISTAQRQIGRCLKPDSFWPLATGCTTQRNATDRPHILVHGRGSSNQVRERWPLLYLVVLPAPVPLECRKKRFPWFRQGTVALPTAALCAGDNPLGIRVAPWPAPLASPTCRMLSDETLATLGVASRAFWLDGDDGGSGATFEARHRVAQATE